AGGDEGLRRDWRRGWGRQRRPAGGGQGPVRARVALAAAIAALLATTAAPAGARGYRVYAGAGHAETTPPVAGSPGATAADARFGPSRTICPAAAFPSSGRFALQEPFDDLNGDGQWDAGADLNHGPTGQKPDPFCDANANGGWDGIY